MKANEAPEKIYLEREIETDRIQNLWGINPVVSSLYEHIEYCRTEVFIEKACEWLKNNITYIHPRKGTKECIINLAKFKDYMKGE